MSQLLVQSKASMWGQFKFHRKLLSSNKKDILLFFSSPYRIGLILLFTFLYLPHAFVVVEDISLVRAYEVDPGSILDSIESLYQPSHFYNMNVPYHSRFYGWTYYWINFVLAAPGYILMKLGVLKGYSLFLVLIRLVLFLIGLASVLAFFEVTRQFLKHELFAFLAGLLYMASPAVSRFFYFIHPETTGLLFLFLGILCLQKFHQHSARDLRWYVFGLLSLVLSVLSKHGFVFIALPVLFLYLYIYCHHRQISPFRFLFSRNFGVAFLVSFLFAALIFFVINPFAFLQPRTFIENQLLLFSTQTHGSASESDATAAWLNILGNAPLVSISLVLFPLSLLGAIFLGKNQKMGRVLYVTNLITAVFFTLFHVISLRYIIYEGYLAPIYPLFILNILSIPLSIVRKWDVKPLKFVTLLALAVLLSFVLVKDVSVSVPAGWARLRYQDSLAYKSYKYIETNIPDGRKIAFDYFVAIPSHRQILGCRHTRECSTDYIEQFDPDYVIFSPNWTFAGTPFPPTERLKKYIRDHNFRRIATIPSGPPNKPQFYYLEVWKKPKQ